MATIHDVALDANVSPTTVSRYINNRIELPPATAARIDAAIAKLDYRPNLLAKRLSTGRTEAIGLVTPEIREPFFAELAFLVTLYRSWRTWQYYAGAVFVGLIYPVLAAASFDLWSMPTWALVGFFALTVAGCVAGVALGILIADRLKRAGVARVARRRSLAGRGLGRGDGPAGQH